MGKKIMVETINRGNDSTNSKNTNPYRRAIHIQGGMEHNLAMYAKNYSCGHIKLQSLAKLVTSFLE
jgi:hypothetical protein